jgi:acyl carrier protein
VIATGTVVDQLRELIIAAAPDPTQAVAVRRCSADAVLDGVIPFSSVIALGVIVAIEDHFGVVITRDALRVAFAGGVTLQKLALMIEQLSRVAR